MTQAFPFKYTDEVRKAGIDFTQELNGDTIASARISVLVGDIVPLIFAYNGTACTFELYAGSPMVHRLMVQITTSSGDIIDCPVTCQVRSPNGS